MFASAEFSHLAPALLSPIGTVLLLIVVLLSLSVLWTTLALHRARRRIASLERAQVASAERWQATIESIPDGLMLLDADMRLSAWNRLFPQVCGVPADVLQVGMHIEDILRAQAAAGEFGSVDARQEASRRAERIRLGQSSGTIERLRPNGQILELRRSRLADGGFITLYNDVTVRRNAEQQLRRAQKMEAIGHLTAGVAHDFNNFLTVISGNLGLAARALEPTGPTRAQSSIALARQAADRATSLTQRLVAFSRGEVLEPQPVAANQIVAEMTELLRHSMGKIELRTVLGDELWPTMSDPSQLENALLNLAVNARDAMPNGGTITIQTSNVALDRGLRARDAEIAPGDYVMIAISDNGVGMAADQLSHAFEPFYTTKEIGKGSGIGLSQVSGFVKTSNGHITLFSEPGVGTTVRLYLPRHVPSTKHDAHRQHALTRAAGTKARETILVVDEDQAVLACATAALEALDYRVVATRDPDHALSSLETNPSVALLLADLGLPAMSGTELARQALLRRPGLAVLLTTGYPAAAASNGLYQSLRKPFSDIALANAIRAALDGVPLEDHRPDAVSDGPSLKPHNA